MSIAYPLAMPGFPAPSSIRLTQQNMTGVSASQFTGAQQVQQWPGEWWEAEWSLQPLTNAQSAPWRAFLAALRGQAGTFSMGTGALVTPSGTLGQRPNLIRNSTDFTTSSWGRSGGLSVAASTALSPWGGACQTITFPAADSASFYAVEQFCPNVYTAGQTFTASVWLYSSSGTNLVLYAASGAVSLGGFVTIAGGSWQRVGITGTFPSDCTVTRGCSFYLLSGPSTPAKTVLVWGAQLERNPAATAYYGDDNPGVLTGAPGAKTVVISGYNSLAYTTGLFAAGDYLQIGGHVYMALAPSALAPDNTWCPVDIFPALRNDVGAGTPVYHIDPAGLWRLQENPRGYAVGSGLVHDLRASNAGRRFEWRADSIAAP